MAKLIFNNETVARFITVINSSKNNSEAFLNLSREFKVSPATCSTFYTFMDKSLLQSKRKKERIKWTEEIDRIIIETVLRFKGRYTSAFYELSEVLNIPQVTINARWYKKLRYKEINNTNFCFHVNGYKNIRKRTKESLEINTKNTPKKYEE